MSMTLSDMGIIARKRK